jgi:YNFM family putative membrane transporter
MLLMMLVGLFMMQLASIPAILIGLLIFTFSFFAAHSTASSWVSIHALKYRATASSLYLFAYYLGSSVLGSSSGLVWQNWGWMGVAVFIGLILALGIVLSFHLRRA